EKEDTSRYPLYFTSSATGLTFGSDFLRRAGRVGIRFILAAGGFFAQFFSGAGDDAPDFDSADAPPLDLLDLDHHLGVKLDVFAGERHAPQLGVDQAAERVAFTGGKL